jgi:hypothetical protein
VVAEFVEWDDSWAQGEGPWLDPADLDGAVQSTFSVGYIAHENDVSVSIAQSFHLVDGSAEVAQWGHVLTIPKCAITRRFRVPVV